MNRRGANALLDAVACGQRDATEAQILEALRATGDIASPNHWEQLTMLREPESMELRAEIERNGQ